MVKDTDWLPSATLEALKSRAQMLALIRQYFAEQLVLEVETPLLCSSTALDPYLESFTVPSQGGQGFLQTSPEFPMKRLLAAGSGSIYQICKAFRVDEAGSRHNPEFTLLEWYRVDWCLAQLVQETIAIALLVGKMGGQDWAVAEPVAYGQLFESVVGVNPFAATVPQLQAAANQHLSGDLPELDRLGWLDLLMAEVVEPAMPQGILPVIDFPAEQAALAQKAQNDQGHWVAKRFELYINGVESANGYQELVDPEEQRDRFNQDNRQRAEQGLAVLPLPEYLLDAMNHGLPDCAGVAMGLDRLLMLAMGEDALHKVLAFASPRA